MRQHDLITKVAKRMQNIKIEEDLSILQTKMETVSKAPTNPSVLFIDTNLGIDHAIQLANDGFPVYYSIPSGGAYPTVSEQISGDGFKLTKTDETFDYIDKVDMFFFVDCYDGSLADYLRKLDKPVFGPSREWTKIENDRVYGYHQINKMGIAQPPTQFAKGLTEAISIADKLLKTEKKIYIKVNKVRGNIETFGTSSVEELKVVFNQAGLGPYIDTVDMLIQSTIKDAVEIGFDVFFNGTDFIRPYNYTIENKGCGTTGRWVDTSGFDKYVLDKIKPSLIASNYRGNISFEGFWDGKEFYSIDVCSRLPFPNSSTFPKNIKNFSEVIKNVAYGLPVKCEVDIEYSTQLTISSEEKSLWRTIEFDPKFINKIGFRRIVKRDDGYYFVPGDSVVACAMGYGTDARSSIIDAENTANEIHSIFSGHEAGYEEEIMDRVATLAKLGSGFEFDKS